MTELLEKYKAARALIADEANWTQGAMARDMQGVSVAVCNTHACRFCSLGAAIFVGIDGEGPLDIINAKMNNNITQFNDNRPHSKVLAALDAATLELQARK